LVGLSVPQVANAQEWLRDRRYSEGQGIRAGDVEIHPSLAGEIGYDSNWFLRSDKEGPNVVNGPPAVPPEGAGVIRITPSLTLSTISVRRREGTDTDSPDREVPKLRLRGGVTATYREFIGSELIRKQRNISGMADLRLDILPDRPVGGALFASYSRTIQPNVIGNPDITFNRHVVGGGGEVIVIPGGGTLDWRAGYQVQAMLFEDDIAQGFQHLTHEVGTRGRWRFRPRTAFIYDFTQRFISYSNSPGQLHNSMPVRARLGLSGLVTNRFALLAMAGWGASFFDTRNNAQVQQFDSVIGQLEGKFYLTANPGVEEPGAVSLTLSSVTLGYMRDFQNSLLGNYYAYDRGYLRLAYFFAARALLNLEGGVGALQYPNVFFPDGTVAQAPWTDVRADATVFGEYRVTNTVGINATFRFTGNFSSTQIPVLDATGTSTLVYDMNWKRFEAFLGARWFL
jgi:hypothetical protein